MDRRILGMCAVVAAVVSSWAVAPALGADFSADPCAEIGAGCRVMTAVEIKGLAERFRALQALLPAPDPTHYKPDGAGEASTMPFVAETSLPGAVVTCSSWPAGCFTTLDSLTFGYDATNVGANKPQSILEASENMQQYFEAKIEVSAWLRPHPYPLEQDGGKCVDVADPDAQRVEENPTFLAWETDRDGGSALTMVFGPRSCKEADLEQLERPGKVLAPIVAIELQITGPAAEVAALKKRIDRAALARLLGPAVK